MPTLNELQSIPCFADLSAAEIALLSAAISEHPKKEADVLFQEGEEAAGLLLLLQGDVTLTSKALSETDGEPSLLHAPAQLGSMALLTPTKHLTTATVASETAQLLHISRDNFQRLLSCSSTAGSKLLDYVGKEFAAKVEQLLPLSS